MEKLLTTNEFAEAIGASESSVRRWTNDGVIRTAKTAGGHRRIPLSEAVRFVRESGSLLVRPEALGLPAVAAGKTLSTNALELGLYDALCAGDTPAATGCVAGLYLNGLSAAAIFDGPVQRAMKRIGELWPSDPRAILTEHRATSICLHALGALRRMIPEAAADAPIALGGAPDGDPYLLPSLMASVVVAEAGCREMNFGPDTPVELLATAAEDHHARLVWLALKAPPDRAKLRTRLDALAAHLASLGVPLVVGGVAAEALGLRSSKRMHVMRTMNELAAFARGAVAVAGAAG